MASPGMPAGVAAPSPAAPVNTPPSFGAKINHDPAATTAPRSP